MLGRHPRVILGNWPTPLTHLTNYGQWLGHGRLYMKRDDLTDLGLGGNKVRNIEFQMGEALSLGADTVIAAGGLQSNQVRLAMAAARKLGLRGLAVHNAHAPQGLPAGNMLLHSLLGTEAVYLGPVDEDERGRYVRSLADSLRSQGARPYIIEQNACGALGYVQAALELAEQSAALTESIRHVVIVGAMGGTAAGFLFGTAALGVPFRVHVISVEYSIPYLKETISTLWEQLELLTGIVPRAKMTDVACFYDQYLGGGYGISAPAAVAALRDLARREAIFVENVYNSKTLWGASDLIRRQVIPPDEPVCLINTGGVPALFAQAGEIG